VRRRIIEVPRDWLTPLDTDGRPLKRTKRLIRELRASLAEHDYRLVLNGQIVARQERDGQEG
jgi:hypothetical protein